MVLCRFSIRIRKFRYCDIPVFGKRILAGKLDGSDSHAPKEKLEAMMLLMPKLVYS